MADIVYTIGEHGQELIAPGPKSRPRSPKDDVIALWPDPADDDDRETEDD